MRGSARLCVKLGEVLLEKSLDYISIYEYKRTRQRRSHWPRKEFFMFTIDKESLTYFVEKLSENQALRVFFGGFG